MAGTETVFQPMHPEILPREIKAQVEEERWGAIVKVVFRSVAKLILQYIPVSQDRDISSSKMNVKDAQAVHKLKIYGKGKKFCHE